MAQVRRIKRLIRELNSIEQSGYYPYFCDVQSDDAGYTLTFLNAPDIPVFKDLSLQCCINKAYDHCIHSKRIRERLEYLKRVVGCKFTVWIPTPDNIDISIPELFEVK